MDRSQARKPACRQPRIRHIAIRIRQRQGGLLNNIRDWKPARLLQWHREKARTIEAVHDVLKNELAAGVLPRGRFGAHAAWLRLSVPTYNALTALKRLAVNVARLAEFLSALRLLPLGT